MYVTQLYCYSETANSYLHFNSKQFIAIAQDLQLIKLSSEIFNYRILPYMYCLNYTCIL